jgi:hypothetical protein
MGISLRNFFASINPLYLGNTGQQTQTQAWQGIDGAAEFIAPQRLRDVVGKLKVSQSQNIYDADFEYGTQPLRWEQFIQNVSGNASIVQNPGLGGVVMTIGSGVNSVTPIQGDITIRQSRPYHRYQPGKTMYMASNVNFGGATAGQFQRVGIFDDSNGIFFMQNNPTTANPYGMYAVIRSDSGGLPTDTLMPLDQWNMNPLLTQSINWGAVQMIWMEYAWYGAGALRWGVVINGEPYILHQVGTGNSSYLGTVATKPWSRTGNLPVRYEQRNNSTGVQSVMTHYGVSVLIEGGRDQQRGFTYSYGNDAKTQTRTVPASAVRYPALSFRMRTVGTDLFDSTYVAASSGTQTSLTIGNSGAVGGAATISSMVGQGNNGQALITFSGAHGYPVTNIPANQPAQYITLSSFSQAASITAFTVSGTTLTVTANTGVIDPPQILTGTGIVGSPTIVGQLTATNAATASPTFVSGGAVGTSSVTLSAGTSIAQGQLISGTGVPAGTFVNQVIGATVTLSQAFTIQASGTYNFYAAGFTGTYQVSSAAGIAGASGTLTATQVFSAGTYLIQSVPSTTTILAQFPNFPAGASPVSVPTATYWAVNQWVGKFIYYAASLPTIATISGLTGPTPQVAGVNNYSALVTFATSHYLQTNDSITISNASPSNYNGTYSVTVVTANQVRINFGPTSPGAYTSSATATTPYTARIISNTATTLTFQDLITSGPMQIGPSAGNSYFIGLIDRGQLLPQTLLLNSSATCLVELIASTPTNQVSLQGVNFVALNALGSYNSFAEQDLSSVSLAGGEVVYAFSTANNGLQQLDLTNFFPVLTNIKGNIADILTVAVTSSAGATVQVNVVCQEAMA